MTNKLAMVTGASEGIGKSFALKLSQKGYRVTIVARSEVNLKNTTHEMGTGHKYIVADLATTGGQEKVIQELSTQKYDLLVNNAGVGVVGEFLDQTLEKQIDMIHLNCMALVKLSHTFLSQSKAGDTLVNVSSALAFVPTPGMALYSATKSFVTAFSEAIWYEQKKRGVYVVDLCPGITTTRFQVNAGGKTEDLPKGVSQTPDEVVDFAFERITKRSHPTIISGYKNKVFSGFSRLLTRRRLLNISGSMMKSKK